MWADRKDHSSIQMEEVTVRKDVVERKDMYLLRVHRSHGQQQHIAF